MHMRGKNSAWSSGSNVYCGREPINRSCCILETHGFFSLCSFAYFQFRLNHFRKKTGKCTENNFLTRKCIHFGKLNWAVCFLQFIMIFRNLEGYCRFWCHNHHFLECRHEYWTAIQELFILGRVVGLGSNSKLLKNIGGF